MNALAFLLGTRALAVARSAEPVTARRDEPLPPIASTPATAAAWRRWRVAAQTERAIDAATLRNRRIVRPLGANPG